LLDQRIGVHTTWFKWQKNSSTKKKLKNVETFTLFTKKIDEKKSRLMFNVQRCFSLFNDLSFSTIYFLYVQLFSFAFFTKPFEICCVYFFVVQI
jgi:hypothetical protein